MDISEEDPVWLKAKADDFFRSGDYLSAVNAYSAAIDTDPTMLSSYSNRSACYLKLKMYQDCKEDCSFVIEEIRNKDSNPQERSSLLIMWLKLLLRRGIASCSLGCFDDALADYRLIKSRLEGGEQLAGVTVDGVSDDVSKIETLMSADNLKKQADEKLKQNFLEDAVALYSQAINILPIHVGCLANRATCYIALGELKSCIDDASSALNILHSNEDSSKKQILDDGFSLLASILPPHGSEKRKAWVVKTLAKRAAAYAQLGELDNAIADYSQLVALEPKDSSLMSDLTRLKNLRAQSSSQ